MNQNNSNFTNLRIIQTNPVEPIVYQSNHSITSGYGAAQSVSTIELTSSQGSLSSYLPKSGISCLNEIPSIHIHQVYELNDSIRGASENRFTIKTHNNESLFLASEGSTPRDRLLWGSSRSFMMHLTDKFHHEALTLRRVFGCHCVCFPFKKQCIEVWLQSGILLGVVQEKFSLTSRKFDIESERGEVLYQVEVSLGSTICMPKEFHFRVLTPDQKQQSATITRQWNVDLSCYTMNIYFSNPSLDSKIKSLFLGLGFLLEYLFFQSRPCCC